SRAARYAAIRKILHEVSRLPAAHRRSIWASSTTLSVKVGRYEFRAAKHRCNRSSEARAAPVGAGPRTTACEALQPPHGAGLCGLDPPLHSCQWQAPSARIGRGGSGGFPDPARHAKPCGGGHAEPGAGGIAVLVSRGTGAGLAVVGRGGAREK